MNEVLRVRTKVKGVRERQKLLRAYRRNPMDPSSDIVEETANLGWFVWLDGSWESLYFGKDRPNLEVGDKVEIIIMKV